MAQHYYCSKKEEGSKKIWEIQSWWGGEKKNWGRGGSILSFCKKGDFGESKSPNLWG